MVRMCKVLLIGDNYVCFVGCLFGCLTASFAWLVDSFVMVFILCEIRRSLLDRLENNLLQIRYVKERAGRIFN